ncbi:MAG: hypothetical protein COU33_00325 [Candidatus Magasanikbacteria bacterium CG10_big_fil_rev_8_21_14_0_10_43_6]|uniref:Thioredoxin domain-containing protein n=1 Tax=Candidatus Magasanikbacteria bacterium CG10_big_fil_rev_8_21_14_0_10_43_6 TaxID=1974650 RepID=A0A2M6W2C2_9BACT|nr:MAG: hypothetical protein COU33_00325 [Candidatus Magasanikbacteria bacterium CG10_big_fil_rev_8_21_14_0_10_43_6]
MQDQAKQGGVSGSMLGNMSPAHVFIFGIVEGILVLCTIGFFIMLGLYFGDGASPKKTKVAVNPTPTAQPVGAPTAEAGPVSLRNVDDKEDHIRGDVDAEITLVEYSDFECPFCSRFTPTVDQILADYDGDVRVVYRHFPLRSIHAQAAGAAEASECAAEQGKFWEFHDELFANQASLGASLYSDIAGRLGLNVSQFESCVSSNKYASAVQEDEQDAQAAGGRGTPYSVLIGPNGETVPLSGALPFSSVKPVIDELLAS